MDRVVGSARASRSRVCNDLVVVLDGGVGATLTAAGDIKLGFGQSRVAIGVSAQLPRMVD
jgi:hypothetical protein